MLKTALFAAALALAAPVCAINKCTDVKGKVSYQDEKCPPGKAEELQITDNVSQAYGGGYGGYGSHGNSYGGSSSSGSGIVHTGPRGGHYTVGPSGNKNYISRSKR